jgi:CHAT domain-containing protein
MAAFAPKYYPAPQWAACALAAFALVACSAAPPPQTVLAESCHRVSGAAPLGLQLRSSGTGTLRIAVRELGISLTATLEDGAAGITTLSPAARYGVMTLLIDARPSRPVRVQIRSSDSRDIVGEACVAAELVSASAPRRLAAERAFAAAGRATFAQHWQLAFDDYLAAARSFDHLDQRRAADARHAMAQLAYRQLRRDRDGYALAQRALSDFGRRADPGLRSALVALQANIVIESKDDDRNTRRARALKLLDAAGGLARHARYGARELARLTLLRGYLEYVTSHSDVAAGFFATAADQCRALADWECYARARQNGALIAQESGHALGVSDAYEDALAVLSPAVAPTLSADIWDSLGRVQSSMGRFKLSEQSQLNAMRLYAQSGSCDGARRALSSLGSILVHVGNLDDAMRYLDLAAAHDCAPLLSLAMDEPQHDFHAAEEALGPEFGRGAGAPPVARAACDNPPAAATLSAEGTIEVFRALLATTYGAKLEADQTIAQRCLAAAARYASTPRLRLRLANATGEAYIDSADAARAAASFRRALEIADEAALPANHPNRAVAYLGLAQASLLSGNSAAALRYGTQALLIGSARADVSEVVSALQVLATSLQAAGNSKSAAQTLRTAVNLIEQVPIDDFDAETRATFLATQHGVFEELTDLSVQNALAGARDDSAAGSTWSAFAVAERGRARSLQYALSQATNDASASEHEHLAANYLALLKRISAVATSAQNSSGWSGAVGLLEALSTQGQHLFEPLTAEELTAQLDRQDATLVEYATGHNDMFAFVIEGRSIQVVRLGDRKNIASAAAALFERLRDPEAARADVQRASAELARLALWPLTAHISRGRVILVPDDSLHGVPFAVLPWSEAAASALVLQHAETSVAPSALFLIHPPERRTALSDAPRLELIGDPVLRAAEWQAECARGVAKASPPRTETPTPTNWTESARRIPGSRIEVLAIAQLARAARPASHIGVSLGCSATPTALRRAASAGADVLHIATHGYIDALRPRLSALALSRESDTQPDGGVFGLLDILGTRTTSRLVVLSACDTSRGRLLPGEGRLGLAQAFLQSGAASVLASYWRIGDASTATFMSSFYKYLLTEQLTAAAALRRAQLDALSAGRSYDWAAFALFGWSESEL